MLPVKRQMVFIQAKELVMVMEGLSEDGFNNRYMHDPAFNKGVHVIAELYMGQKDDVPKPVNELDPIDTFWALDKSQH